MNIIKVGRFSISITPDIFTFGLSIGLPFNESSEIYAHFVFILLSWDVAE